MRIVERNGTFYVERPAKVWAQVLAALLIAPWLLFTMAALADSRYAAFLVVTFVLGIPGIWLAITLGTPKRTRIIHCADGQQVPGGVMLRVVDARNVSHQIVVEKVLALGIALAFTAPS